MKNIKDFNSYNVIKENIDEVERSYDMLESYFDQVKFNLDSIEDTLDELAIPEFEAIKSKIENILNDFIEVKDEFMDIYEEHNLEPSEDMNFLEEKWKGDVEVEKTGEHADKTIGELKTELADLKKISKKYQDEGKKVPQEIREQESEIVFAIRAKQGWKKTIENKEEVSEKWDSDVKVKKTGEHSDKTIEELEDELKALKRKSARYQKEGNPVPKKIKEKESEINFAIRAKRHWK